MVKLGDEAAPRRQEQTVAPDGRRLAPAIEGVREISPPTHQDERGSLCEIYSDSWGFDAHPMVHAYLVTVRPGRVKGWAVHMNQTDRYFFCSGSTRLVLYDGRAESPTAGLVTQTVYSEINRTLVSVPPGVYHAVEGLGPGDSLLFNIPSAVYDYAAPDKLTLPLENDVIPFRFERATGH